MADVDVAAAGVGRIEWADADMPVLRSIRTRFRHERPLAGLRVAACLHVTASVSNLVRTLAAGGAEVVLCASNPMSTDDEVAAALVVEHGISVFAARGEDADTYYEYIYAAAEHRPHLTLDDGGDLIGILHADRRDLADEVIAGTEDTATGVMRLRAMEADRVLRYPVIAVDEAQTKQLFDNRHGAAQSTIDGILRATNALVAGSTFVVAGYGWSGKGLADRVRGLGAHVIVCEVEPMRALQAVMDGCRVLPALDAAALGDVFCTATGTKDVFGEAHFARMKDGAVLANAGHFNVEIDVPALDRIAVDRRHPRPDITQYRLADGRRVSLIAEGRVVNMTAGEGRPAAVMDMSLATHALVAEYLARHGDKLDRRVYTVPDEIDREIARLKLDALGVRIDTLTAEQVAYLSSWSEGT